MSRHSSSRFLVPLLASALLFVPSCRDSGAPVTPPDNSCGIPQQQLPWPGLAQTPWPMARHDPQCTGRSQYRGPQLGKVKALFHPTYDCTVPVVGADTLFFVGSGGSLLAISFSGDLKWGVNLGNTSRFESPPVLLADGSIFIMGDKGYSLRLQDTTLLPSGLPFGSTMRQVGVGKDGTIYAVGGGRLYAVRGGSLLWSRTLSIGDTFNGNADAGIAMSPDGASMYVPAGPERSLYALDLNGDILWADSLDSGVFGTPSVDNAGNLFVWTKDSLVSLTSGKKRRWALYTGHENWDVTIDNMGNIAFLSQGYLWSVTNDGQTRWKVKVDDQDFFTPLVTDADGTIYCVTCSSGILNYNVRAVSSFGVVKWILPITVYLKLGGCAITKEGYLIVTDTGIDAATLNSIYVIE
jgi:hypothetical protein